MNIVIINGSTSGSKTAKALSHLNFGNDVHIDNINLSDVNMSFADGRDYREYDNDNKNIVEKIVAADAIIIGTPIYQASIPGSLKNVLDILPINSIQSKPVGVIVTAGSARHYLVAQQHLLPVLNYLKSDVIAKYVFIESSDFASDKLQDDIIMRIEALTDEVSSRVISKQEKDKLLYDFL